MQRFLIAALLSSTVAFPAQAAVSTIKTSGYWAALYMTPDPKFNFYGCAVTSGIPRAGVLVQVGITNNDQMLRVSASKRNWNLPTNIRPQMTVTFDDGTNWTMPHNTFVPSSPGQTSGSGLALHVRPSSYALFVHEFTAGHTMTVSFSGNEPDWKLNLWGVTALWDTFMECAQGVAPQFAQALIAQQEGRGLPYGPNDVAPNPPAASTLPYGPADGGGNDDAQAPPQHFGPPPPPDNNGDGSFNHGGTPLRGPSHFPTTNINNAKW